jgi:hypothetical protein
MNDELDTEKDGKVFTEMTAAAIKNDMVKSITYSFVEAWGASGGGDGSTRKVKVTKNYGRTTDKTVSHAAMARVKVNQAWVVSGQAGAAEIEGKYDFSVIQSSHDYMNNHYEE